MACQILAVRLQILAGVRGAGERWPDSASIGKHRQLVPHFADANTCDAGADFRPFADGGEARLIVAKPRV